jgi:putative SOS response-associated peptidase YedK
MVVDVHDRRYVVLEPEDALRWLDAETAVEEAAHIAQAGSLATEDFIRWKVDRAVNRVDPSIMCTCFPTCSAPARL